MELHERAFFYAVPLGLPREEAEIKEHQIELKMHQVAIKQHQHVFVQYMKMNRNISQSNHASLKCIHGQQGTFFVVKYADDTTLFNCTLV